jgi:hypothetical protein
MRQFHYERPLDMSYDTQTAVDKCSRAPGGGRWTRMEQESVKLDFVGRFKISDGRAQQLMFDSVPRN